MPVQLIYAAAGILVLAIAPLPYGFYIFARIVATGAFAWGTVIAAQKKMMTLAVVFGLTAVLFNPFIKIHLPKEIWMVLDLAAAGLLLVTSRKIKS